MALHKLSDFFNPAVKLIGQFTNTDINEAVFAAYVPDIDRILYHYYADELARGTPDDAVPMQGDFMRFILAWWRLRVSDFNAVYNASVITYNPLENYSMNEQTATAHERATMQSSTDADVKPRISTQYETTNDDHGTGRMTGYNVGGLLGTAPNPDSDGSENSTTTNEYTDTKTLSVGDMTATGHEVETVEHNRHGNIGVQSSQDMLGQEYDVRLRSFIMYFCTCFERECLTGLYDMGGDF